MGVRYGWSILPVIFLVLTCHLSYSFPLATVANLSLVTSLPLRFVEGSKATDIPLTERLYKQLGNTTYDRFINSAKFNFQLKMNLKSNYALTAVPTNKENQTKKPSQFYSNQRETFGDNFGENSFRDEHYTIDVLPSPISVKNVDKELHPDQNINPNVGIGIVVNHGGMPQIIMEPPGILGDKAEKLFPGGFYSRNDIEKLYSSRSHFHPNHITIDAQFLPWAEGLHLGESQNHHHCLDPEVISRAARMALRRNPPPAGVTLVVHPPPKDFKCTERHAVEYFLSQLTLSSTKILIGGVEPSLCRVASQLAEKYEKLLILWSCLEVPTTEEHRFSFESPAASLETPISNKTTETSYKESKSHGYVALVTPVANQVARSVRAALQHLGWRRVSILTIDSRYWMGVTQVLDAELRAWRHLVPAIQVLSGDYSEQKIINLIKNVISQEVKAFLLVLPSSSPVVGQVMRIAGEEGLTKHTALILVDPLLEPQSQIFTIKPNNSVTSETPEAPASADNETDSAENVPDLNPFPTVTYNRTKVITRLTEQDLIETKRKHLDDRLKLKQSTTATEAGTVNHKQLVKRSKNDQSELVNIISEENFQFNDIPESMTNSNFSFDKMNLEKSNPEDINVTENSISDDVSDSDVDVSEDILKNLVFRAPQQLASLPLEVTRSVFVSVPKSVGARDNGGDGTANYDSWNHQYSNSDFDEYLNEDEEIVSRLAFDSVSLASHIIRRNVGVIHLRKRKRKKRRRKNFWDFQSGEFVSVDGDHNVNSFTEDLINYSLGTSDFSVTISDNPKSLLENLISKLSSPKLRKPNKKLKNKMKRQIRIKRSISRNEKEDNKPSRQDDQEQELPQQEEQMKVRDKILHEVKRLQEHGDRSAEERIQNILVGNVPSSQKAYAAKRIPKLDSLRPFYKVTTKLTQSTFFGAYRGDGLVLASGKRSYEFLLLDWKPSLEALVPVLRIHETNFSDNGDNNSSLKVEVLANIDWAFDEVILRDPMCEFLGIPCVTGYVLALAPAFVALIVVSILITFTGCCIAAVFIRNYLRQKALSKGPYKILLNSGDITLSARTEAAPRKIGSPVLGERPDLLRGGHLVAPTPKLPSNNRLHPNAAKVSLREADAIRAKYNGDFVHMRYFYSPGNFEVKNKTMSLLKQMHELRHENINSFLGLLCDPVRPGFVFDYSQRGSLEDIIKQKDIKLDWSFKLSLLTDLVRGLRYLHSSPLKVHGRLTSRNCVIDARWVLKVTDYGLGSVYEVQNIPHPMRSNRDLLWKAPELLRSENLQAKGTQPGDVFSFAIIMQEIVVRGAPYCMVQLTHPEIIARLKKPPPMIRPSVSKGAAPPDVINIMKQCWAELPDMRPDFNQIYDQFKKLNQGRRLNIVDTMFQMLEKYSSNLEDLIRERTEQLHVEKKKTEQLLNRMLPSTVADQLKLGKPVAPEEFDEVTIYFSDIVGFTTISAYSTPFEVVDLLNDLYTAFDATINHYNVYKVETIGDAYMVVGGVPCRIEDHASQIATMALDLLHLSGKFRIRHLHNIPLMLRIGIHTGPCCAGVVGVTMPRYCLFGDTVNTASRMESTGSAWRIHVSETTAVKLREVGGYILDFRGRTQLKGKGLMPTYWLLGKDNFNKELPVPPEIGHSHGLDEELVKQGRQHYATRRDSTNEVMASAIKIYNHNRQQQQQHSEQAIQRLNPPPSPFYSGLLPDRKTKRVMKQCPIIVRVENVDAGSCENVNMDLLRMSPLLQSPDKDLMRSEQSQEASYFQNSLMPNDRTCGEVCSGFGISYSGFSNVSKFNSSSDFIQSEGAGNKLPTSDLLGATLFQNNQNQGSSLAPVTLKIGSVCASPRRGLGKLKTNTQGTSEGNDYFNNTSSNILCDTEVTLLTESLIEASDQGQSFPYSYGEDNEQILIVTTEEDINIAECNFDGDKKRKISNDKAKHKLGDQTIVTDSRKLVTESTPGNLNQPSKPDPLSLSQTPIANVVQEFVEMNLEEVNVKSLLVYIKPDVSISTPEVTDVKLDVSGSKPLLVVRKLEISVPRSEAAYEKAKDIIKKPPEDAGIKMSAIVVTPNVKDKKRSHRERKVQRESSEGNILEEKLGHKKRREERKQIEEIQIKEEIKKNPEILQRNEAKIIEMKSKDTKNKVEKEIKECLKNSESKIRNVVKNKKTICMEETILSDKVNGKEELKNKEFMRKESKPTVILPSTQSTKEEPSDVSTKMTEQPLNILKTKKVEATDASKKKESLASKKKAVGIPNSQPRIMEESLDVSTINKEKPLNSPIKPKGDVIQIKKLIIAETLGDQERKKGESLETHPHRREEKRKKSGRKELSSDDKIKSKKERSSRNREESSRNREESFRSRSSSPVKEDRRRREKKYVKRNISPPSQEQGKPLTDPDSHYLPDDSRYSSSFDPYVRPFASSGDVTIFSGDVTIGAAEVASFRNLRPMSVIRETISGSQFQTREPSTYQRFLLEEAPQRSKESFQLLRPNYELPSPTESTML